MCQDSVSCVPWLIHVCAMTWEIGLYSYVPWLIYIWHNSFIRDMTHAHECKITTGFLCKNDLPNEGIFREETLQSMHAATRCNTLQITATRCNTMQHTATHYNTPIQERALPNDSFSKKRPVAVYCSSLICGTVCLQCHNVADGRAQATYRTSQIVWGAWLMCVAV